MDYLDASDTCTDSRLNSMTAPMPDNDQLTNYIKKSSRASDMEIISIEGELNAIVSNIYGSLNNYFK
jgi:hypothetical protein